MNGNMRYVRGEVLEESEVVGSFGGPVREGVAVSCSSAECTLALELLIDTNTGTSFSVGTITNTNTTSSISIIIYIRTPLHGRLLLLFMFQNNVDQICKCAKGATAALHAGNECRE